MTEDSNNNKPPENPSVAAPPAASSTFEASTDQNLPLIEQAQDGLEGNLETIDLSSQWSALSVVERRREFEKLPRLDAVDLFLTLKTHDQAELISEASLQEKRSWVRLLAPDDVADLIQELVANHGMEQKDLILDLVDPQTRREVTALLAYAEDNAGGLMSSRFVRLRPDMTVDEAISYLRIQSKTQVETIYYAYVLASDQKLLGVVSFRELFSALPGRKIKDIMKTDIVKIPVELDQEQIGRIFSQQELVALPVIDQDGLMKGIVTFDDVATVIQEEATEDIQKMGAVETLGAPYLKIDLGEMIKKRAGWLLVLFIGEMFTATAMGHFQLEIERAVVLAMFMPLIISSGGNSGSQATTLIIRAMALSEVRLRDWWRVLRREIVTGLALGSVLGAVGFARIVFWPWRESMYGPNYFWIAVTVALSVVGVVMWGSVSGSMLPFILRSFKLDPAAASAPAVATIVDVTGLVIYFSVASMILHGILL